MDRLNSLLCELKALDCILDSLETALDCSRSEVVEHVQSVCGERDSYEKDANECIELILSDVSSLSKEDIKILGIAHFLKEYIDKVREAQRESDLTESSVSEEQKELGESSEHSTEYIAKLEQENIRLNEYVKELEDVLTKDYACLERDVKSYKKKFMNECKRLRADNERLSLENLQQKAKLNNMDKIKEELESANAVIMSLSTYLEVDNHEVR